jgi:hypothetical protein
MMEWINVKDRLPEKTEHRPASMHGYENPIAVQPEVIVATLEGRVFQTSYSAFGWANLNSRTDEVTHWMPLPEPPKDV